MHTAVYICGHRLTWAVAEPPNYLGTNSSHLPFGSQGLCHPSKLKLCHFSPPGYNWMAPLHSDRRREPPAPALRCPDPQRITLLSSSWHFFVFCSNDQGYLLGQLFPNAACNWDSNSKIYITGRFTKSSFMNIARLICLVRCRGAIKSDWLKTIKTVKVNCLCPLKPAEAVSWKLWASMWKLKLLIFPCMYVNIRVLICFVFTGWKPLRSKWRYAFNKLFWWS